MDLRQALFKAIDLSGISAKELSEIAKVTPTQISRFRKGKDISSSTLQRLIDGLPPEAYAHFHSIIAPKQNSNNEIADQLFQLAHQLKKNSKSPNLSVVKEDESDFPLLPKASNS